MTQCIQFKPSQNATPARHFISKSVQIILHLTPCISILPFLHSEQSQHLLTAARPTIHPIQSQSHKFNNVIPFILKLALSSGILPNYFISTPTNLILKRGTKIHPYTCNTPFSVMLNHVIFRSVSRAASCKPNSFCTCTLLLIRNKQRGQY